MGELGVIFGVLTVLTIVLTVLLYKKESTLIFLSNATLGLLLSVMAFTSQPDNFIIRRVISALVGLLTVIGITSWLIKKEATITSKILITVSIIGSLVNIFIF